MNTSSVDVLPLKVLLRTYISDITQIDLLNIDVEGFDLDVLKSNDWNVFVPKVIVVEDHLFDSNDPLKSEIYAFLTEKAYTLHIFVGFSLIFVKK